MGPVSHGKLGIFPWCCTELSDTNRCRRSSKRQGGRLTSSSLARTAALAPLLVVLIGCASVDPSEAQSFQEAVTRASQNVGEDLARTTEILSDYQLLRVLERKAAGGLSVDLVAGDFDQILPPDVGAALRSQLALLASYADLLRKIADRSYSGDLSAQIEALRTQANETGPNIAALVRGRALTQAEADNMTATIGLLSEIASLAGEAFIDLYAQHNAMKVVRRYDKPISEYCAELQNVVAPTEDYDPAVAGSAPAGLAFLTDLALQSTATLLVDRFEAATKELNLLRIAAAPSPQSIAQAEEKRRAVAIAFRETLHARRTMVSSYSALRKAIGEIAKAHHALASDDESAFWTAVNRAVELGNYINGLRQQRKSS